MTHPAARAGVLSPCRATNSLGISGRSLEPVAWVGGVSDAFAGKFFSSDSAGHLKCPGTVIKDNPQSSGKLSKLTYTEQLLGDAQGEQPLLPRTHGREEALEAVNPPWRTPLSPPGAWTGGERDHGQPANTTWRSRLPGPLGDFLCRSSSALSPRRGQTPTPTPRLLLSCRVNLFSWNLRICIRKYFLKFDSV